MYKQTASVADIDGFIDMLRAACVDSSVNATLRALLSLPDKKRKAMVLMLVKDLASKNAPRELIEAISCLVDDTIAEKAYEVIYHCTR